VESTHATPIVALRLPGPWSMSATGGRPGYISPRGHDKAFPPTGLRRGHSPGGRPAWRWVLLFRPSSSTTKGRGQWPSAGWKAKPGRYDPAQPAWPWRPGRVPTRRYDLSAAESAWRIKPDLNTTSPAALRGCDFHSTGSWGRDARTHPQAWAFATAWNGPSHPAWPSRPVPSAD